MVVNMEVDEVEDGDADSQDWLVQKTHRALKEKDLYEAKCWLITAKSLFPLNFKVQYEAYSIENDAKRVKEAAGLFLDMMVRFPNEKILSDELCKITEALEAKDVDINGMFLKDMFNSLSRSSQKEILLNAAAKQNDCSEKCRLTLLLIKKFPESVKECAISLTQLLLSKEQESYPGNPVNIYRKLLVCNVLPVLVSSEQLVIGIDNKLEKSQNANALILTPDQVTHWLELSIQYTICCQFFQVNDDTNFPYEVDYTSHDHNDLWVQLHELLCLIGNKCAWVDILRLKDILSPNRSVKDSWSCLSDIHHNLKKSMKVTSKAVEEGQASSTELNVLAMEKIGVLYASVTIFFRAVWEYCKIVNRTDDKGITDAKMESPLIVLLEDLSSSGKTGETTEVRHIPKKKKKLALDDQKEKQQVHLSIGSNCVSVDHSVCDYFLVAADAWHMLHSHSDYKNEFSRILDSWKVDEWQWMAPFQVDRHIYRGKFKKAIELLQDRKENFTNSPSNQPFSLRCSLQLSSVISCLGDHKKACGVILEALEAFWEGSESLLMDDYKDKQKRRFVNYSSTKNSKPHSPNDRHLELVECTEDEALSYCVQLLVNSLKNRTVFSEGRNDKLLGHLIVLLQYDWPKRENLFIQAIKKIQSQASFKYTCFFDYVIVIDILEEFAYLYKTENVQIELLPKPSSNSRSRSMTRGLNKGSKEDLKSSLERQVTRANESIESILRLFFIEEKNSLV